MKDPTVEEVRDSIEFLRYRDTFSRVMHEMAGWSIAEGVRIVNRWVLEPAFRSWFGHTSPTLDAAPRIARAMMSTADYERFGQDANLHREIAWAIEGTGDEYEQHPDTIAGYDWQAARQRAGAAISDYAREST